MNRAIVYCQLQHDIPRCFWTSLKKTRELWDGDIYLIAPQREAAYEALKQHEVKFIPEESIGGHELLLYQRGTFFSLIHPGWDGFWDNACKRFVYLYEVQRMHEIDEMLHIESDVVPYISFYTMFEKFSNVYQGKLAFSKHAPFQLSCCTVFSSGHSNLGTFCNKIVEYFERGTEWFSTMYPSQTILNETHFAYTFQQENPELVDFFPVLPSDKYADEFGFLIDSTAWGMWVDGLRWNPGKKFATPNHTIGKMIIDDKYDVLFTQMKTPYVFDRSTTSTIPLATLHFNSKEPEKWI